MKAVVLNDYGSADVLELKEVKEPEPKENEVQVSVNAAAIHAGDIFSMRGSPWAARLSIGFPKPTDYILGWDMAGRVHAIGRQTTRFHPGDEVFASCRAALAESVCVPEDRLAARPTNLTFEQAAAVPTSAITALQGLRDAGRLQPGQKVLINGASGGVGTFAVQIAKAFGAEVTGVCSTRNVDLIRSIGADHAVDYTQTDFTKGEQRYDLVFDNVANRSFSDLRRVLSAQGTIIPNSGHGGIRYVIKAFFLSLFIRQQGRPFVARSNADDLSILKELIESGKITPIIDRTYPLSEAREAFRYLAQGHARGKVVITVANYNHSGGSAT
jgi:NADPH:quinone reductase-like Zn-dependent oxidoreductase